jgi:hypothetical protein
MNWNKIFFWRKPKDDDCEQPLTLDEIFAMVSLHPEARMDVASKWNGSRNVRITFKNGYGASIIWDGYGKEWGLMEVGVTLDGSLCYTTPLADDVMGYIKRDELFGILTDISILEPAGDGQELDSEEAVW